jgi:hypothetical protein
MKKTIFIIGLAVILAGYTYAQEHTASALKKVAEGDTHTPFGKYTIMLQKDALMLEGEMVKQYRITYENSPISVLVIVDKEEKCKNYIVVSDGLSVMYKCNGQYFGINRIDEKYKKEGYVTDDRNLNRTNYMYQKVISLGQLEEVDATAYIAAYYPALIKL